MHKQAKSKNTILLIGIALLFIALTTLVIATVNTFSTNAISGNENKINIQCTISTSNPRGIPFLTTGSVEITNTACKRLPTTGCFPFTTFSFFGDLTTDYGEVSLWVDGDKEDEQDYAIPEGTTRQNTLTANCIDNTQHSLRIQVTDDDQQVIQQKTVAV